jgi:formate hydrogenlyase subunit 6/NADH:ubiquinone oxidoreductase subunit I
MKERETYLGGIFRAWRTVMKGMKLSGKHYRKGYRRDEPLSIMDEGYFDKVDGPITIQYPEEKVAIPDNGRYRLHMETDDCIACDKCARICPVDCITIDSFRADGDLGRTSDGTVKRLHLPVFDIDMGKCMYCGLCTTVCPTDCLTMTKVYDYSEYDRDNFVYHFGAYSPQEEDRIRAVTAAALAAKAAEKATEKESTASSAPTRRRPVLKPTLSKEKPDPTPIDRQFPEQEEAPENSREVPEELEGPTTPRKNRPRPIMKRRPTEAEAPEENAPENSSEVPTQEEAPENSREVPEELEGPTNSKAK